MFALEPHWLAYQNSPSPAAWVLEEYQKRGIDTVPLVDALLEYAGNQTYDATISTLIADIGEREFVRQRRWPASQLTAGGPSRSRTVECDGHRA